MKRSAKRPVLFGIKAHIKAFLQLYSSTKYLHFRFVNPFFIGALVFLFFYMRLCNNDSGNEGIKYFDIGEYSTALDHYNEYLMLYPHHIETLYNRGRCFEALGYPAKAAEDYEHVLDRDPYNIMALLSLSQIYYNEDEFEITINLCKNAIMIDEQNYLAHYFKARAHHKNRDFFEAIEEYNAVVDINPDYGNVYLHRGNLYLSYGWRPFGCYDLQTADCLKVEGAGEALLKYCR